MKEYITAIELGSSKVSGIVGRKTTEGIQICAYASEPSSDFISKGIVQNIDKTAQSLTNILNRLETSLGNVDIKKFYIGIGGQSLHSIPSAFVYPLQEETQVTQEMIDDMLSRSEKTPSADFQILGVIPMEYIVNGKPQKEPLGITCNRIEGNYLNIVSHRSILDRIERSFKNANIEIADSSITPLTTALSILTDEEKGLGCTMVDMGANTTSIAIFKGGMLRRLAVIPLGGNNITKDLCNEQIDIEEAEQLKITYGYDPALKDDKRLYPVVNERRELSAKLQNEIIEARIEEIFANVKHQIDLSGYNGKLISGMVLTGGGAGLKNLTSMITARWPEVQIRIATRVNFDVTVVSGITFEQDATQTALLGLLAAGKENCCNERVVYTENPPAGLFDPDELPPIQNKSNENKPTRPPKNPKPPKEPKNPDGGLFDRLKKSINNLGENLLKNEDEQ